MSQALQDSDVNQVIVDQITGHKLDDTDRAYSSDKLREAYVKALPHLMISTPSIQMGRSEFLELMSKKNGQIADHEKLIAIQYEEISTLKNRNKELERKLEEAGISYSFSSEIFDKLEQLEHRYDLLQAQITTILSKNKRRTKKKGKD